MKVLMISTDRNIFKEDSAVRARMIEYGKNYDELHIIIFSKKITSETKIAENVFVYPTNSLSKFFYILDAIRIGKKILRSGGFQLTCQDPFECGFVGWKLSRKLKIPLELQIHTDIGSPYFTSLKLGWSLAFLNFTRFQIAKFLLPKADKIRVVSFRIKSFLLARKIIADKIEVRPIKINLKTDGLPKQYPQFDFIALAVGRLEPEKNISLAIDAWQEVVKKFPRAGLIIVGSGSELKFLKFKVQSLKLGNNIAFESWTENLAVYYKTADVFLNTSFYEGYGMALAEATIADCPIVSSDVGAVNEILQSNRRLAVCPIGDKNCFVAKITELFK